MNIPSQSIVHLRVQRESELWRPDGIAMIEKNHRAIYVFESCIGKSTDKPGMWNWINQPVSIFYQPDPAMVPEGGSHYFGIYRQRRVENLPQEIMICNAISCAEPFTGVVADNGDIIYSRYRHDMRTSPDESVWIDGGRDYLRYDGKSKLIGLQMHREYLYEVDL